MKLTKNADPNKYGYTDYGIWFDPRSQFSLPDGNWGKISLFLELVIVFLCMLITERILILGEDPAQGLDYTTITAQAKYSINLTKSWERFALSRHYNGINSFLFVNATKTYQFNAKDSESKSYSLRLSNI